MKAIILDNNEMDADVLSGCLKQLRHNVKVSKCFNSIESFKKFYSKNEAKIDVIFTDLNFGNHNIFELMDISKFGEKMVITTDKPDFAVDAFRHNVTDYLIKPVMLQHLNESIAKVKRNKHIEQLKKISNYKSQFQLSIGKQVVNVKTDEIEFIESCNKMSYIYLVNGKRIPSIVPLVAIENKLDPEIFFRANRQTIIHFNAIKSIEKNKSSKYLIHLKSFDHKMVALSEEKTKAFKIWMDR